MAPRVPYVGELKIGTTGDQVVVYRTALINGKFLAAPKTKAGRNSRYCGIYMARAFGKAQKAAKLPVTNTCGPKLHNFLAKPRKNKPLGFFTKPGVVTLQRVARRQWLAHIRVRGQVYMHQCLNAYSWYYSGPGSNYLGLRMEGVRKRLTRPISGQHEDCSSGASAIIGAAVGFDASICDPNGNKWASWGFTGTMASHGWRVSREGAKILDCHFYGRNGSTTHVIIQMEDASKLNKLKKLIRRFAACWSFGGEPGPASRMVYYRGDYMFSVRYID
jgi:hypothetical protein